MKYRRLLATNSIEYREGILSRYTVIEIDHKDYKEFCVQHEFLNADGTHNSFVGGTYRPSMLNILDVYNDTMKQHYRFEDEEFIPDNEWRDTEK